MAETTVETIVANPARKRHHRMAKRMTLKQKLHFGSARQRAAAKAALRGARKRKRNRSSSRPRHRRRSQNPGEIIAMTLGNPARKKGRKRMAATHRRRRHASRANAGHRRRRRSHVVHHRRRRRHNPARRRIYNRHRVHHRRRHNPGGVRWADLFVLGGGALVGSTLSSAGTQLVLGTSNTGAMGYAGNLIATLVLSWLGGMVVRNRSFPAGILAGGIGSLMRRIIADYSLLGGYTAQLGMGDYMVANWVTPQRLASDFRSLTEANVSQGQWGLQAPAMSSSGVSVRGMGLEGDPGSYGTVGY
jgi:hypothetical protein